MCGTIRTISCPSCKDTQEGISVHHNGKLVECLKCSIVSHHEDSLAEYRTGRFKTIKPFEYKPKVIKRAN